MWVLIAGFVAYGVGYLIREWSGLKGLLVALWALSYPVIFLHIIRGVDFNNVGQYLGIGLVFLIAGMAILYALVNLELGESARLISGALLVAAIGLWLVEVPEFGFFDLGLVVARILLLVLAVFAIAAPTFGGSGGSKWRYMIIYGSAVVVIVYLMLLATGTSIVQTQAAVPFGGFMVTWLLAIGAVALSFPIGVMMALARTSSLPIFRVLATVYIEIVRGVPLITWLLMSVVVFPFLFPEGVEFEDLVKVLLFFSFFSAAYLAENVRGGLQAVTKGQTEASNALGMSTAQRTAFITLPQALRAVIPALVGQVIATFKDTSLVLIVGIFDLLTIAKNVVPSQSQPFNFLGSIKENLVAVALIYWVFTYIFSRVSQRIEKNLGVGER
jgi:general L-amino acid transport system permease protein